MMLLQSSFWMAASISASLASQPQALVYRGPAACEGCAESVAQLLSTSPSAFNVKYIGPGEDIDINSQTLAWADVYAQPGGGGTEFTTSCEQR